MSKNIRHLALAWPFVSALCCTAALGQTRDDVLRCRAITEDTPRLACYDALPLSNAAPRGKYQPVALRDLSDAPLSYRGQLVEVSGQVVSEGGGFALSPGAQSGREIPLDIEALPRQQRDRLRQGCAGGCEATIQGRVGPVRFVTGILADAVFVR